MTLFLCLILFLGFAKVPHEYASSSICLKVQDNSMAPKFNQNDYVYVEFNTPLNNKDFGLFEYKANTSLENLLLEKMT